MESEEILKGQIGMLERGRVVALKGDLAVVQFLRSSACEHCGACLRAGESEMLVEVRNTLGAKENDEVSVELPEKSFFSAAALLYGIPLVALVAALFIASALTDNELVVIGVSIGCAALSFILLRVLDPLFRRSNRFSIRMVDLHKVHEMQ